MKRYFIYVIMAVATLVVGCTIDQTDTPEMVDVGDIEVTYSVAGEELETFTTTPQGQIVTIDVEINYPGIYWTPTSDKEWCRVVEEKHFGNGSFKLNIAANTTFYTREEATITFTAGEYKESVLKISQEGNIFFINKHYATMTKAAANVSFTLSTPYEYEVEASDWINPTLTGSSTDTDVLGRSYNILNFVAEIAENSSATRFGYIHIKRKGEDEVIEQLNIWQYGTDVEYDNDGNILIAAKDAEPFEIRIPTALVESVSNPSWAELSTKQNDDATTSYLFTCGDNPSDASHIRDLEVEFSLFGNETVSMPFVKQNYYDVGGIISCHGLALLSKTFNEGGDCERWKTDGKLVILNDIDMSELTEWTPIGTEARPFNLEFDGGNRRISNFKSSKPFFGYCSEAKLSNFIFDESVELTLSGSVSQHQYLATLARSISSNTTITDCSSNARLSLNNMKATADLSLYVGGLVALSDATSSISNSKFYGAIENPDNSAISTSSKSQGTAYVGGIVAHTAGTVEGCVFGGNISHLAVIRVVYTGGIASYAAVGSVLKSNSNNGSMSYNSLRRPSGMPNDASRTNYAGGIAGVADGGHIEGNIFNGRITSGSNIKIIYYGGVVGNLYNGQSTFKNNSTSRSSKIIVTGAARYVCVGGFTGFVDSKTTGYTLDFTNDESLFEGEISGGSASDSFEAGSCYMGGVIGGADAELTLVAPKWSGYIDVNLTSDVTWHNMAVGGIVGAVGRYADKDTLTAIKASISGAVSSGEIVVSSSKNTIKARSSMGGVVGWNYGGLTLSDSSFTGSLTWLAADARANGYVFTCGGLVGSVDAGTSSITNCHNKGALFNWHYNNNGPSSTGEGNLELTYNYTGGIIGSYGYVASTSGMLTIEKCSCDSAIATYRGGIGGIAGYLANSTVKECSFTGGITLDEGQYHYNCIYGGIVSTAANQTTISDCVVRADMDGMVVGSCPVRGGGIAAITKSGATIANCKFYGNVNLPNLDEQERDEYCGGLVGDAQAGSTISNCSYGGYVCSIYVNSDELAVQYALGTATVSKLPSEGTATNITYWNGEE